MDYIKELHTNLLKKAYQKNTISSDHKLNQRSIIEDEILHKLLTVCSKEQLFHAIELLLHSNQNNVITIQPNEVMFDITLLDDIQLAVLYEHYTFCYDISKEQTQKDQTFEKIKKEIPSTVINNIQISDKDKQQQYEEIFYIVNSTSSNMSSKKKSSFNTINPTSS